MTKKKSLFQISHASQLTYTGYIFFSFIKYKKNVLKSHIPFNIEFLLSDHKASSIKKARSADPISDMKFGDFCIILKWLSFIFMETKDDIMTLAGLNIQCTQSFIYSMQTFLGLVNYNNMFGSHQNEHLKFYLFSRNLLFLFEIF